MTASALVGESSPSLSSAPSLRQDSRLSFQPLSIVADGDEYLVGNATLGVFISIPQIGVLAIRALQAGQTIAETAALATREAQEEVDVLDFAEALLESGLVAAVDGVQLESNSAEQEQSWLAGVRPELVRPFFSRFAWSIYALLFVFCLAAFLLQPQLWPTGEDFFFYPNPAISVAILALLNTLLIGFHELCHWLAGRAAGVSAKFRISRRLFFPVFETDLTQLWSVPRRQRYGPFLAGLAFDTVILALCLGLRLLWGFELLDLPPLLHRLLGAVVLLIMAGMTWQALVFLRTDLYAVLITALGCINLYRVNLLYLKSRLWRLSPAEKTELQAAHPRDLRAARWFAWLYLVGIAWAGYFLLTVFIPGTFILGGWMFSSLAGAPLSSAAFWEALTIGLVASLQGLLPLGIALWEWRARRKQGVQ